MGPGDYSNPSCAYSQSGVGMAVWENAGDIWGRIMDSNGPVGSSFLVNQQTQGQQRKPKISSFFPNSFLVVWESESSNGTDGSEESIQIRAFGTNGAGGTQLQVNTYIELSQHRPSISAGPGSTYFTVAWQSYGSSGNDDSFRSVQARRYT